MRRAMMVVVVLVLIVGVYVVVQAQGITPFQQWEYAMLVFDSSEGSYTFTTSVVYDEMEFEVALGHELTKNLFEALDGIEDAGLVDYMAAMGVSGFELVDSVNLSNSVIVYNFKRPEKL